MVFIMEKTDVRKTDEIKTGDTKTEKLIRTAIFSSVGYLCAGITVSLFAGINLWTQFLETDEAVFSLAVVLTFILSAIAGIVLIRYLVPKIGAKTVYEQDILVAMIGMLFIALSINIAMLFVGIIVCSGALAVFFYENFTRQLNLVKELNHSNQVSESKQSKTKVFYLSGWALGPIIAVLAISIFSNLIGVLTLRILFAHFIVISFWLWIQRLGVHESFADAPTALLAHPTDALTSKDLSENKASSEDPVEAPVKTESSDSENTKQDLSISQDKATVSSATDTSETVSLATDKATTDKTATDTVLKDKTQSGTTQSGKDN
jgi:MFS family permease